MNSNITIIGAGIVGLATAVQLLKKKHNLNITVLEKEDSVAQHQTGNNSGVIHSGIYYKPGSLKAENCRKGYRQLLEFCDENEIKYNLSGKIIVATEEKEIPFLDEIYNRGIKNGLEGLKKLSISELKVKEPHVNGIAGIFVPQTGYIDFKQVAEKYADIIRQNGAEIRFNEKVTGIKNKNNGYEIITEQNNFETDFLISCAGLYSDKIAKMTNPKLPLLIVPFRGEYYKLREENKYLVRSLIYPVPDPKFPFLGVHFTNMINGDVECGPNAVLAFKREGYGKTDFSLTDFSETIRWRGFHKVIKKYWKTGLGEYYRSFSKVAFTKALQKLIPEITSDALISGGAGVRAQACDKTGGLIDDFYFAEDENVLHVCNAPSPAATASLAIGEQIAERVIRRLK